MIQELIVTAMFMSHYSTLLSPDKPATSISYYIDIIALFTILMTAINSLLSKYS